MENLKNLPDYKDQVISLVEKSFSYPKSSHFEEDFSPLFIENNSAHLHFLKEDDQVVGTALCQPRELSYKGRSFPCLFIGGITVSETHRGKGLSKKIFDFLEKTYKEKLFFILWSDLNEFYQNLGFVQMGMVYEYECSGSSQTQNNYPDNYEELYQALDSEFIIPTRTSDLWKSWIEHPTILKEESSSKNKGFDLKELCHEFYPLKDIPQTSAQKVWSPSPLSLENETLRYLGLFKVCSPEVFKDFVSYISSSKINIINYSELIEFEYDNQNFSLDLESFLTGAWGPSFIEEFQGLFPPFYIPGFDSI